LLKNESLYAQLGDRRSKPPPNTTFWILCCKKRI